MSHSSERPRRLSYAGLVGRPTQQKSRRISDAGQIGNYSQACSVTVNSGLLTEEPAEPTSMTAMLHDSGRYEMNKNRNSRRTSRPSRDDSFTCSQQSVLSAMDRFVKAVNNMDSTVLLPSRLQDMEVHVDNDKCMPTGLNNSDVYRFYIMLKDVKTELLWGPTAVEPMHYLTPSSGRSSPSSSTRIMKHVRQPSDDSLGSTGFPSDQETDSDIESVVTDRDSIDENGSSAPGGSHLASAFRHHLLGLHTILHELADSADYLSSRYQEDIESTS